MTIQQGIKAAYEIAYFDSFYDLHKDEEIDREIALEIFRCGLRCRNDILDEHEAKANDLMEKAKALDRKSEDLLEQLARNLPSSDASVEATERLLNSLGMIRGSDREVQLGVLLRHVQIRIASLTKALEKYEDSEQVTASECKVGTEAWARAEFERLEQNLWRQMDNHIADLRGYVDAKLREKNGQ